MTFLASKKAKKKNFPKQRFDFFKKIKKLKYKQK